jgi:hypothetical protein
MPLPRPSGSPRPIPKSSTKWFDARGKDEQEVLLRDPRLKDWYDRRGFEITEWAPSADDLEAVADVNGPYVKSLDDGDDGTWQVGGFLVLLGDGHTYTDWVRDQADHGSGTFRVERARFGAGKLVFSDVPPVHQGTITSAVGAFSDKDVVFE